ncbi:MAG: hypothetical protein ACT4PY_00570 [Armatimonadota bacterium]
MSAALWLLQRASGLLLVLLVGIHVGVQHGLFRVPLRRTMLIGVDWLLLAVVLYHGLNGVRTVAYDYIHRRPAQRMVDWALWIAGLVLFFYGSWGLLGFIR